MGINKEEKELLLSIVKAGILNQSLDLSSLEENSELMRVIIEQTFQPFLYKISRDTRFKKYYFSSACFIKHY